MFLKSCLLNFSSLLCILFQWQLKVVDPVLIIYFCIISICSMTQLISHLVHKLECRSDIMQDLRWCHCFTRQTQKVNEHSSNIFNQRSDVPWKMFTFQDKYVHAEKGRRLTTLFLSLNKNVDCLEIELGLESSQDNRNIYKTIRFYDG